MKELFINVGKTQKEEEEINTLLVQAKGKLSELDTQNVTLKSSIEKAYKSRDDLESTINRLNVATVISKLKYDFYHAREFSARSIISFRDDQFIDYGDAREILDPY